MLAEEIRCLGESIGRYKKSVGVFEKFGQDVVILGRVVF